MNKKAALQKIREEQAQRLNAESFIQDYEKTIQQLQSRIKELNKALYELYYAVPNQTNDADWWPDELTEAMKNAYDIFETPTT